MRCNEQSFLIYTDYLLVIDHLIFQVCHLIRPNYVQWTIQITRRKSPPTYRPWCCLKPIQSWRTKTPASANPAKARLPRKNPREPFCRKATLQQCLPRRRRSTTVPHNAANVPTVIKCTPIYLRSNTMSGSYIPICSICFAVIFARNFSNIARATKLTCGICIMSGTKCRYLYLSMFIFLHQTTTQYK